MLSDCRRPNRTDSSEIVFYTIYIYIIYVYISRLYFSGACSEVKGRKCQHGVRLAIKGKTVNGAPRVWSEKYIFCAQILMKQPHDCSY